MQRLLIANRGEIAIRIARTASDMGIETLAIYSRDDAKSLHCHAADNAIELDGEGAAAYLNAETIADLAARHGCDAVHPGYGFLSEQGDFCRACEARGVVFVGPRADSLDRFGDKVAARAFAEECGVPVPLGVSGAVTLDEALAFFERLGEGRTVILKAVAGGGGRGMRPVSRLEDLASAYERCSSEAAKAFGSGEVYVEEFLPRARHVEVQIVGDGSGAVSHLWDRECSLQRQRQKIIEIAPAFALPDETRQAMLSAAVQIGERARYRGVGTVEFLVDADPESAGRYAFIELNARLQVEHTVTEEILGLDLVRAQLELARGRTLADLKLSQSDVGPPQGAAIQARINLETIDARGAPRPSVGTISTYEPPTGPGVRVDGAGFVGYVASTRFDPLLAKLIARADTLPMALSRTRRALAEFRIAGLRTNIGFLSALLASDAVSEARLHTRFIEENAAALIATIPEPSPAPEPAVQPSRPTGARVDASDPLAVLSVKAQAAPADPLASLDEPEDLVAIRAPVHGTLISLAVEFGDPVRVGQPVAVMEALKMEHIVVAEAAGFVRALPLGVGETVLEGAPILFVEPAELGGGESNASAAHDLDVVRDDAATLLRLHALTGDAARAEATAKRQGGGKRTARENIADLCDPGSFVEYGSLVTSGRRHGESLQDVEARLLATPGDGLVMGVGRVNGDLVGEANARCIAMSYDYTVLAGTQGGKNHQKTDRMLEVAERFRLPVVFYTEGGGGRTRGYRGDQGGPPTSTGGLKVHTWRALGKLSGLVPLVGVTSGRCFAGNAVILGLCDVIIATRDSTIGVGGPAMIEGGGLGQFAPEEVGPVRIQEPNGVIDIVVEDEDEATQKARQYLSYFQGPLEHWSVADQRALRYAVPQNRKAVYDVRKIIETLADEGSMLELRRRFGAAMVTAFIRIEGRPVGLVANNSNSPTGGAVDSDSADKAARFMQLCDGFDIPIISLIDTPGNMVGPVAEATGLLRHLGRLYVIGANLSVPMFAVVLRKAYGLGALAMSGGGFASPFFTVAWPTGEFAGMGLEGQVKLGRRAELLAIEDLAARRARYDEMVAAAYAWGNSVNGATVFEFDDAIDPADTRRWLAMGLRSTPPPPHRTEKKHPWIDTW